MPRSRITIQTTPELDEVLDEIGRMTGKPSRSEVVRDALEFYDLFIEHARRGKRIFLGEDRQTAGEVLLPHIERVRMHHGLTVVKDED